MSAVNITSTSTILDPRLYLVLDPHQCRCHDPLTVARAAVAGGATLVQLRDKRADTRALVDLARALVAMLRPSGVPLLINDRVDVALAAGADGVHVGQSDMPAAEARRLLGEQAIIGLTVRSPAEAREALQAPVDYLGLGGVFATRSKDNPNPPIGLTGLAEIVTLLRQAGCTLPLTAISGIQRDNLQAVMDAGVQGVALVSAICAASSPEAAARELRQSIDACLGVNP